MNFMVNWYTEGIRKITNRERFIIVRLQNFVITHFQAYGGLRGAIAFALIFSVSPAVPAHNIFLGAAYFIILFTVFVQVGG